jgi:hypothetical protein
MPTRSRIPTSVTLAPCSSDRSSHRHARPGRRFGRGAGPVPPRSLDDRHRRSPAGRSPARPSPVAATGAATGSPPEAAVERGSERPRGPGPARSPGRIASSRARSEGPWWRGAGAIGSSPSPGAPRSPAGWRASRAAAGGRARPSGRQALATAGPACGQDTAAARTLHSGAKAVFLGAVALLGLEGLLRHRACAESSPSGLGVSVIRPQKARKRADRPMHGRGAFIVRRMIGRGPLDRQTSATLRRRRGQRFTASGTRGRVACYPRA